MLERVLAVLALIVFVAVVSAGSLLSILPAFYDVRSWWRSLPHRRDRTRQVRTYIRERKSA